ncbi:MAG: hypothetical protein RLZZ419_102 [Pseudomonadota bacterium]|jgi:hypothetical protein
MLFFSKKAKNNSSVARFATLLLMFFALIPKLQLRETGSLDAMNGIEEYRSL